MRGLNDEELEKNAKKTALGQRKQLKKVQDIHNDLCSSVQVARMKGIRDINVDRLTFKSFIIDMNGPSYRLKAMEQWINERKNTDKRHK